MGVSGSGKSTVGAALAAAWNVPFLEGDRLHPPANVAKMAAGTPLTDQDREPWLDALAREIRARAGDGGIIATCSALKRRYRDRLREKVAAPVEFILLESPRAVLESRMAHRPGHFMPAALLDSQLATLEPPGPDENIRTFPGTLPVEELVSAIAKAIRPGAG